MQQIAQTSRLTDPRFPATITDTMPAPLTVDWEAVKASAISTGSLSKAAQLHDIPHNAVKQRSFREKWPVGIRAEKAAEQAIAHAVTVKAAARVTEGRVTGITTSPVTASEALERHMTETRDEFRTFTATAIRNASRAASRLPDDDALENSRRLADLTAAGTKLHGLNQAETQVAVQVLNQW